MRGLTHEWCCGLSWLDLKFGSGQEFELYATPGVPVQTSERCVRCWRSYCRCVSRRRPRRLRARGQGPAQARRTRMRWPSSSCFLLTRGWRTGRAARARPESEVPRTLTRRLCGAVRQRAVLRPVGGSGGQVKSPPIIRYCRDGWKWLAVVIVRG